MYRCTVNPRYNNVIGPLSYCCHIATIVISIQKKCKDVSLPHPFPSPMDPAETHFGDCTGPSPCMYLKVIVVLPQVGLAVVASIYVCESKTQTQSH